MVRVIRVAGAASGGIRDGPDPADGVVVVLHDATDRIRDRYDAAACVVSQRDAASGPVADARDPVLLEDLGARQRDRVAVTVGDRGEARKVGEPRDPLESPNDEVSRQRGDHGAHQGGIRRVLPLARSARRKNHLALIRTDEDEGCTSAEQDRLVRLQRPADAEDPGLRALAPVKAPDADGQPTRQRHVGLAHGEAAGWQIDGLAACRAIRLPAVDLVVRGAR